MVQIAKRYFDELKHTQKLFDEIAEVFRKGDSGTPIVDVKYDVIPVEFDCCSYSVKGGYIEEYLVVTYRGGAIACRCCNINSFGASFEELGKLTFGGYYDEVDSYEKVCEKRSELEVIDVESFK